MEFRNSQNEEAKTFAVQLQEQYAKGYDKAVETIQRFQNMRPQGPPSSAASF